MVYTSYGNGGTISVRVGNRSGTLSNYYNNGGPPCPTREPGATFVVDVAPGTHSVSAEAQNGVTWSFTQSVSAGGCQAVELYYGNRTGPPADGDSPNHLVPREAKSLYDASITLDGWFPAREPSSTSRVAGARPLRP